LRNDFKQETSLTSMQTSKHFTLHSINHIIIEPTLKTCWQKSVKTLFYYIGNRFAQGL